MSDESELCFDCAGHSLIYSAGKGHHKCVRVLIEGGADVNHQDRNNRTALLSAASSGYEKCVELLIKGGADVNQRIMWKRTALSIAAYEGHIKCVELLISVGADVNSRDAYGMTPLMDASRRGHHECVKKLLTAGSDVNTHNNGETSLLYAAAMGNAKCVKILIRAGANVNTRNCFGAAAWSFAVKENHSKQIFVAARADVNYLEEKKILKQEAEMSLTNLSRDTIRNHLKKMRQVNLFVMVPKLGLPKPLQRFLLYNFSLDGDDK